ncbi:protoporphyrinogen oxidase, partial [Candidatus Poribacteria bacterium]|nr:protoporphyrinogen oxidase [Candidatus Poribacteria bacterium]
MPNAHLALIHRPGKNQLLHLRTKSMTFKQNRAIVIGGGITGLAAGYRLLREADNRNIPLTLTLLEARNRVGGVIQTEQREGFIIEHGPDAFISTKPWAKALSEELGLTEKFIGTNPKVRQSFVVRKGRLLPVPEGFYMMAPGSFLPFIKSPIFSLAGKLRIALDLFISSRSDMTDESVADFVRRRLGKEAFERMAQPMIGGIYTSDAENLSLKATFPRFIEMEREHGSIIKALIAQKRKSSQTSRDTSGPRYSLFLSFRDGMQTLVDTLAENLSKNIHLQSHVKHVKQKQSNIKHDWCWQVHLDNGEMLEAEILCIALPAPKASILLSDVLPQLSDKLNTISYSSSATVNLAFRREDISHPLNGMGFVVPITEQRNLIGCSFSSVKFENRAPSDYVLLRAFVGENTYYIKGKDKPDSDELTSILHKDLSELLGISAEPIFSVISQHTQAMAQYQVEHQKRVREIDKLAKELPGLALTGNAYHGIGIP